jgi:hypothetical protein
VLDVPPAPPLPVVLDEVVVVVELDALVVCDVSSPSQAAITADERTRAKEIVCRFMDAILLPSPLLRL